MHRISCYIDHVISRPLCTTNHDSIIKNKIMTYFLHFVLEGFVSSCWVSGVHCQSTFLWCRRNPVGNVPDASWEAQCFDYIVHFLSIPEQRFQAHSSEKCKSHKFTFKSIKQALLNSLSWFDIFHDYTNKILLSFNCNSIRIDKDIRN